MPHPLEFREFDWLRRGQSCRHSLLVIPVVLSLAWFSACAHRRDPQVAFDHALQTLQHGEMASAGKEAEQGYKEFHRLGADWAWKFTILRARTLCWQGLNDRALDLLTSEPAPLPPGDLTVQKHWLEGVAYVASHRFHDAEQKQELAERLCSASDYPACVNVMRARGRLEMAHAQYAQAQHLFERALVLARARGDLFLQANALLDMSWSADEQTHYDEALAWADAARKISVPRDFADIAQTALGNMGWAYYKLGDPEKAQRMFIEAEKQAEKLGDLTDRVKWLTNAGYIYMDARDFKTAEQSFVQSLKLAQQINSREDIINAQIALAFVYEQTGNLEQAKQHADDALAKAREDANGRDQVYPLLVMGRIAARQHDPGSAEKAFREVAQAADTPVFLKWEAERSLARLYEEQNQTDTADREYRTALSTFETARSELKHEDSRLPFLTNATRIYDDYIHFLVARGKTAGSLQIADYSRARSLGEGLGLLKKGTSFAPEPLDAQEIARRGGGAILFYWLGEKQSYLWAITARKTSLFSLPPGSEIDAAVKRYRKALVGPQDVLETANDDGSALYRMLVEPAKDLLTKGARAFIVPDGSLNSLNFETLLVPAPKLHYWIEDAVVSDANSLRLLAASRPASHKGAGNLLLFGDAVSPNVDYPELSKAADEIQDVVQHFSSTETKIFTREQATPVNYLEGKPERFSYIHFVAHGIASRLSPLDSAIVLSKSASADDSFKLYARDIIHRPLRADLVTVSSCYGAGVRAYSGEGMVGLSWAFLRAGAHGVVGALWEVSDVSSPQLMGSLYGELKRGKNPDAALRTAKLQLLHSGSTFRRPFYWAPFQLYAGS
jgi:CHAT domain-containing protein